jgi:hypothetical protein
MEELDHMSKATDPEDSTLLTLLSLHAIAARRGDGLHPVLLDRLRRIEAARHEHLQHEAGSEPQLHASPHISSQTASTGSAKVQCGSGEQSDLWRAKLVD